MSNREVLWCTADGHVAYVDHGIESVMSLFIGTHQQSQGATVIKGNSLPLANEDMDAIATWWMKRNPHLLSTLLTDEEREAVEWAVERAECDCEDAAADVQEGAHPRTLSGPNKRLLALRSLLKEEK